MADFILSCCSTADLTEEHFKARDIHYICFHFTLDGKQYPDDLGKTIPFDQFYKAMTDGADTATFPDSHSSILWIPHQYSNSQSLSNSQSSEADAGRPRQRGM